MVGEMPRVHGLAGAPRDQRSIALTRAQAFLDSEVVGRDLDCALDHPNRSGCTPCSRSRDSLLSYNYLGHRDPKHRVRYTRTAGKRFEGLWR
jgi:hypothetical protein